jgi:CHASE3 domain sensor protein
MDRKTPVILACSVLPLLLIILIASRQNSQLVDQNFKQSRAIQLEAEVEAVLLTMSQAKSAEQGYVLTGKETLLLPAIEASANIEKHLRRLNKLLKDDNAQIERLKKLELNISDRLKMMSDVIVIRKHKSFEDAVRFLSESDKDGSFTKTFKEQVSEIEVADKSLSHKDESNGDSVRDDLKAQRVALLAAFMFIFMFGSNVVFVRLSNSAA